MLSGSLEPLADVLVALAPYVDRDSVAPLVPGTVRYVALTDDPPGPRAAGAPAATDGPDAVVVVVQDRTALRAVVGACRELPASTRIGCVLLEAQEPPLTAGRPHWPATRSVLASGGPPAVLLHELAEPVAAGEVIADLARRLGPDHLMSAGWPVLGLDRSEPDLWTPGDPTSVVGTAEQIRDLSPDYPPDVVVSARAAGRPRAADHPVLGTLSPDVVVPAARTWGEPDSGESDGSHGSGGDQRLQPDGLALGALDGRTLNPIGFVRNVGDEVAAVVPAGDSVTHCEIATDAGPVVIDTRRGVSEVDVARLRRVQAVHVGWRGAPGPRAYCRMVVGLAMAGIPLTCDPVPEWARALVHPDVLEPMEKAGSLVDPLAREVHSIRLRRAAHARHDAAAWRGEVARRAGLPPRRAPRVSVLLPTRRPGRVAQAVATVAAQRAPGLELVLACHGHPVEQSRLRELAGPDLDAVVLQAPGDLPFGQLLNRAAAMASGDLLLKMDDDDWYGPDFVTDLLLARGYSGADVVGTPPEFLYLEQLDLTVRRRDATERFRPVVAGGTMLIGREALAAVGGFRSMRRYVDAALLQGVLAAGGSVYRTHGHDYVLRRGGEGHTWDPGLGYFVSRSRTLQQWRGFRPSPLIGPLIGPVSAR